MTQTHKAPFLAGPPALLTGLSDHYLKKSLTRRRNSGWIAEPEAGFRPKVAAMSSLALHSGHAGSEKTLRQRHQNSKTGARRKDGIGGVPQSKIAEMPRLPPFASAWIARVA